MNVIKSIAAGGAALIAAGCGGGDGTDDAAVSMGSTTPPAATAATTTVKEAMPTVKPPPKLASLGDVPIAAADLHDAYFHWNGETITVAGFPALFTKRAARWQSAVELGAAPEAKSAALLRCDMAEVPDGPLHVDTPLTLRGKVVGNGRTFAVPDGEPPKVMLEECELVSTGGPAPMGGDPYILGAESIPVAMLQSAMFGWQGATVRVVGYFSGTTTSTPGFDESRTVTSHALAAGAGGDKLVDCKQPGEHQAPESVVQRREGTMVAGTIGEPNGDAVVLNDCRFVA